MLHSRSLAHRQFQHLTFDPSNQAARARRKDGKTALRGRAGNRLTSEETRLKEGSQRKAKGSTPIAVEPNERVVPSVISRRLGLSTE